MYQLVGLRPSRQGNYAPARHYDIFAKDYTTLVKKTKQLTEQFAEIYGKAELYNLFYSAAHAEPGNRKNFIKQEMIPFDFDKIDLSRSEAYLDIFTSLTGIDWKKCWVVCSGSGIQLIVHTIWFDEEYIKEYKPHYNQVCSVLHNAFSEAGLPCFKVDTTVWCRCQLLRLPMTTNRKPPEKPFSGDALVKEAYSIKTNTSIHTFPWDQFKPPVKPEKKNSSKDFTDSPPPDIDYILKECSFIGHQYSTRGADASYPEWFAAMGVAAYFDDDGLIGRAMSDGHPGYDVAVTERLLESCSSIGKPRKCDSIAGLWPSCATCKHRMSGVGTPVNLRPYQASSDPMEEYIREHGRTPDDDTLGTEDSSKISANPPLEKTTGRNDAGISPQINTLTMEKKNEQETKEDRKQESVAQIDTKERYVENEGKNGQDQTDRELEPPRDEEPCPEEETRGGEKGERDNVASSTVQQPVQGTSKGSVQPPATQEISEADHWEVHRRAGFSKVSLSSNGKQTITRYPNLLRGYFDHLHSYVVVADNEQLYAYKDGTYSRMGKLEIKAFAQSSYTPMSSKDNEINEFYNKVMLSNHVSVDFLTPAKPGYVNLANGVLEIASGQLLDHSPSFGFLYKLPYDYEPNQDCPWWDQLMMNVCSGDQERIDSLEEFLGYCIYGGTYDYAKVLIFSGEGENGKSTVVNIFQMVLGEDNCSGINISDLRHNKFLGHELIGKLANFSEEEPADCFKNPSYIKRLTGNSPIFVERKREQGHSFVNTAKMVLTYNKMPRLTDDSHGMKRRLMIVPFDLNLEDEPDKKIPDIYGKIRGELSGILVKCLRQFNAVQKRGKFTNPRASINKVKELVNTSNEVYEWFEDSVVATGNEEDKVSTNALFDAFNLEQGGFKQNMTRTRFTRNIKYVLKNKDETPWKKVSTASFQGSDGKVCRGYRGMKIATSLGKEFSGQQF